jgi:hypothetical protein
MVRSHRAAKFGGSQAPIAWGPTFLVKRRGKKIKTERKLWPSTFFESEVLSEANLRFILLIILLVLKMGAGASASRPPHVAKACNVLFTSMCKEYEALQESGASKEQLADFMNDAKKRLEISASATAKGSTSKLNTGGSLNSVNTKSVHQPVQRGLSKGSVGNKKSDPKKVARRRSYGNDQMIALTALGGNKPAAGGMAESASVPALDSVEHAAAKAMEEAAAQLAAMQAMNAGASGAATAEPPTDHWDSVRDLPYCNVCEMAFKTMSALDRHIKYSNLHETTVAKKKAAEEGKQLNPAMQQKELMARQEEGKDFRLLYYGSKFFWRTQDNIDLSFYQHIMLHIIEIVPFDVYKNKELERIYLDKFMMDTLLEESVKDAVQKKKIFMQDEAAKSKFTTHVHFDEDAEYIAMQRVVSTTYLLARLQLNSVHTDGSKNGVQKLMFHSLPVDDQTKDPLLKVVPAMLVPVSVTHRRNTSTEAVQAKLDDLASNQAAMREQIQKAEKVSGLINTFLTIVRSNDKYKNYSAPKKRFVQAVKRVMQINGVERTKKHVEAVYGAGYFKKKKLGSRNLVVNKNELQ